MSTKKRILLIEDEPGLVLTLSDRLAEEHYEIEHAGDGELGLNMAVNKPFDLIILDVMLPKKNGLDICKEIRRIGITVPIVMLTAKGQVIDKVLGLKLGANDYLAKPFEMMELLARIEVQLRSPGTFQNGSISSSFSFADVVVNFDAGEVHKNGKRIALSVREFRLLQFLIEHRGKVVSRDDLLNEVWGYNALPTTRTVDVHVAWLRQKLEENSKLPRHIQTVHGMGYKFVE